MAHPHSLPFNLLSFTCWNGRVDLGCGSLLIERRDIKRADESEHDVDSCLEAPHYHRIGRSLGVPYTIERQGEHYGKVPWAQPPLEGTAILQDPNTNTTSPGISPKQLPGSVINERVKGKARNPQ